MRTEYFTTKNRFISSQSCSQSPHYPCPAAEWATRTMHMTGLCGSRKYPYPPQGRSLEILRGRGVSKAIFFKGKYEAKLEIPGRSPPQTKKPSVGEIWIYSGTIHSWTSGSTPCFNKWKPRLLDFRCYCASQVDRCISDVLVASFAAGQG